MFDVSHSWGQGTAGNPSDSSGIGASGGGFPAGTGDATWNSAFNGQTLWTTPGGDHASTASDTLFLNGNTTGTAFTWLSTPQMVADVQGWLNNPATNFGWELINADEVDVRTLYGFYSSEWATFPGGLASQEPALQITYTVPEPAAGSLGALCRSRDLLLAPVAPAGMNPHMFRPYRAAIAFTLIELLIVVAIIAVLSGLAIAVMGPINAMRDQTHSASNLRQWGVALAAYAADNDGFIPRRGQGVQPLMQVNRPDDWFNALPPYLGLKAYGDLVAAGQRPNAGDNSIFVRPGAKDPGGTAFLSYGMNMNLSPWNLTLATRLSQIARPSVTVFLAETPGQYSSTYPSKRPYSCQAPYRGQGDVLFRDGHVIAYSATYLGVGEGDPGRPDVSWLTGTASDAQAGQY